MFDEISFFQHKNVEGRAAVDRVTSPRAVTAHELTFQMLFAFRFASLKTTLEGREKENF
jgi:hypothetical protein